MDESTKTGWGGIGINQTRDDGNIFTIKALKEERADRCVSSFDYTTDRATAAGSIAGKIRIRS